MCNHQRPLLSIWVSKVWHIATPAGGCLWCPLCWAIGPVSNVCPCRVRGLVRNVYPYWVTGLASKECSCWVTGLVPNVCQRWFAGLVSNVHARSHGQVAVATLSWIHRFLTLAVAGFKVTANYNLGEAIRGVSWRLVLASAWSQGDLCCWPLPDLQGMSGRSSVCENRLVVWL